MISLGVQLEDQHGTAVAGHLGNFGGTVPCQGSTSVPQSGHTSRPALLTACTARYRHTAPLLMWLDLPSSTP